MNDNRFPALLEAALEALVAITDVGVDAALRDGTGEAAGIAYLMERKESTGKKLEERLAAAHGKLQAALKPYSDELERLDLIV